MDIVDAYGQAQAILKASFRLTFVLLLLTSNGSNVILPDALFCHRGALTLRVPLPIAF